ncbi:MAG TPA: hypothetical protein PLB35_01880 [Myxococcota bacterium]|nr:hypothetical protein [Myxococcota bacterium]HOH75978.1 hypothetical protein [Myxococcota bacterium]HPV04421.1 hypothetical protein [Myxococcota bacterium]
MTSRAFFAVLLLAILTAAGCSSDKVEKGRRLIDSEPEKAIALFQEAEKERGECFDCLIYTGLAYERMGSAAHALTSYERAMQMPDAAARPEPVAERLLGLYETAHGKAGDATEKLAIARKAAELEKALKVARPWASMFLVDKYLADMKAAAEKGDEAEVRKIADFCMGLALPAEMKNGFATDATLALQSAFINRATKKFQETLATAFAEKGWFDSETSNIIFRNQFVIPSKAEDPEFNPDSPGFSAALRKGACLPLHAMVSEAVSLSAPMLGLKGIDNAGLNLVFQDLYKKAVAGFAQYGGEKRAPNGQPYLCMIQVPMKDFVASLFRFAE